MTVPPSESGYPPPWNRPHAGAAAWPAADAPPAGLPPQQYPGPGYPPPYPAPGYPGGPQAQPGTNGFAIAALIFGIIGGALLGIIFGFVALSQIKKSGQGGRGMAIAGLVLSGVWILAVTAIAIIAISTSASRDEGGQITSGGSVSAGALKVGDCVNNLRDSTSLLSLPAVPCSQPHEGEVFAVFDLPAGPYPGLDAVNEKVTDECTARLAAYSPSAGVDGRFGLFSVYPQRQNWNAGDREVSCLAQGLDGTTTGSIRGR
jgi:Domain of unknown function (DUF4190)/Septum formation